MHLELTPDAVLKELGYAVTEQTLSQLEEIYKHTPNIEKFLPHLPAFKDALTVQKGYIALSNSKPYFKIKCEEDSESQNAKVYEEIVHKWAQKYKLQLQKANEYTYYLTGVA